MSDDTIVSSGEPVVSAIYAACTRGRRDSLTLVVLIMHIYARAATTAAIFYGATFTISGRSRTHARAVDRVNSRRGVARHSFLTAGFKVRSVFFIAHMHENGWLVIFRTGASYEFLMGDLKNVCLLRMIFCPEECLRYEQ